MTAGGHGNDGLTVNREGPTDPRRRGRQQMVVFEWFERFLGAVAAPDEKYQPSAAEKEESPLWSIMAPDPNFSSPQEEGDQTNDAENAPPPQPSSAGSAAFTPLKGDPLVECLHCHRMTPSSPPPARPTPSRHHSGPPAGHRTAGAAADAGATTPLSTNVASSSLPPSSAGFKSPPVASSQPVASSPWTGASSLTNSSGAATAGAAVNFASPQPAQTPATLKDRIFEAVQATAELDLPANKIRREAANKLLFAVLRAYTEASHKKLAKLIEKDPQVLLYARVGSADVSSADVTREGFTALHVASFRGIEMAVELMLCTPKHVAVDLVQMITLQGKTALHLACDRGHDGVATRLRAFCEAHGVEWQTEDVLRRTPLRSGLMSPKCSEAKRPSIVKAMHRPGDPCIYGLHVAPNHRSFYLPPSKVAVGISDMPGVRGIENMEDATLVHVSGASSGSDPDGGNVVLVGVLDGHDDGGKCSHAASDQLRLRLRQHFAAAPDAQSGGGGDDDAAIQDIFQTVDDTLRILQEKKEISGGTTACVAIVTDRLLRVASVGDSRCVLVRRKDGVDDAGESIENRIEQLSLSPSSFDAATIVVAASSESVKEMHSVLALSRDHKPELPSERKRIEAAGGTVKGSYVRLMKIGSDLDDIQLGMSRSLGDFEYKANKSLTSDQQAVIAVPDIVTRERSENDEFLIVACDGVWDVMTNAQAAEFVAKQLQSLGSNDDHALAQVAGKLCHECFNLGSTDNLSVVLVALGETAERMTPASVASPAATTTTDTLPRRLEYESPMVVDTIQEGLVEGTIQDDMV
jgi:serine/threonine protein phosphatase PrpC